MNKVKPILTPANKLYKVLTICIILISCLSAISVIPQIYLLNMGLKNIDVFSDIRTDVIENTSRNCQICDSSKTYTKFILPKIILSHINLPDILPSPIFKLNLKIDQSKNTTVTLFKSTVNQLDASTNINHKVKTNSFFEDFSPNGYALEHLINDLYETKCSRKKGHIAFYGDSFIEGDIFCSDIRNLLQDYFGGNGVGFVPITSEVSQFRNTILHEFKGFQSYSLVKKQTRYVPYGPGGLCFTAGENNYLTYSAPNINKHLNLIHNISLFYMSPIKTTFKYCLDKKNLFSLNIDGQNQLQQSVLKNVKSKTVNFYFPASDSIKLYGVSIEDSTGIYVDNFSLRGNAGLNIMQVTDKMHRQFNKFQNYQLIVLQYGLNVVAPETNNLVWYRNAMIKEVQQLKMCYPDAIFLIMSVSDRSTVVNGKYITMQSIPLLVSVQREIAMNTQSLFYNLYEAMGGENSMVNFVNNDPPLANKDYTHLNSQGGRKIANIFVKDLLNEYQIYNDKNKKFSPIDSSSVVSSNY